MSTSKKVACTNSFWPENAVFSGEIEENSRQNAVTENVIWIHGLNQVMEMNEDLENETSINQNG